MVNNKNTKSNDKDIPITFEIAKAKKGLNVKSGKNNILIIKKEIYELSV